MERDGETVLWIARNGLLFLLIRILRERAGSSRRSQRPCTFHAGTRLRMMLGISVAPQMDGELANVLVQDSGCHFLLVLNPEHRGGQPEARGPHATR